MLEYVHNMIPHQRQVIVRIIGVFYNIKQTDWLGKSIMAWHLVYVALVVILCTMVNKTPFKDKYLNIYIQYRINKKLDWLPYII